MNTAQPTPYTNDERQALENNLMTEQIEVIGIRRADANDLTTYDGISLDDQRRLFKREADGFGGAAPLEIRVQDIAQLGNAAPASEWMNPDDVRAWIADGRKGFEKGE